MINFCITCGQPLTRHDDTCYECPDGHQYFNNPRSGASVILLKDDRFLAVLRGIEPNKGKYSFVGGFLQYGEHPETAARREAFEETGVTIDALELVGMTAQQYQPEETTCNAVYLARRWRGEPTAGDDADGLAWKPLDFIGSEEFAWPQPHILAKLRSIADNT